MILDKSARIGAAALLLAAAALGQACSARLDHASATQSPSRLAVACTISTLCSLVADVGGPGVDVIGIVPVGASPETYEPTPGDVVALSRARIVFENGLGLEAWLEKIVQSAGARDTTRVVLAQQVPAGRRTSGNPHLWLDPTNAMLYVRAIAAALVGADPAHESAYRANALRETQELAQLDGWIRGRIATIPPKKRAMICFHNAWYYFDRRYGIKNVGAIEPLPGQDPSPAYFAALIDLAKANDVRAIFAEPQFSPKLSEALASSAGIRTVANLYDDTLGTGPQLSNYDGMMRYDVDVIVKALRS